MDHWQVQARFGAACAYCESNPGALTAEAGKDGKENLLGGELTPTMISAVLAADI
jgi:hypothetical protein